MDAEWPPTGQDPRQQDPPGWTLPVRLRTILARAGTLPPDDGAQALEMKWDGVRALAYVSGGEVRLVSRTGEALTAAYPELRGLAAALRPAGAAGREIVVLGPDGWPDFESLQYRIHVRLPPAAELLASDTECGWQACHALYASQAPRRRERGQVRAVWLQVCKTVG